MNLLTEQDAAFVEHFYSHQKIIKAYKLLLYDPGAFFEIIQKKGAALLFYDLGIISFIKGTNDSSLILWSISLEEWQWFLLKHKIKCVDSPSNQTQIRSQLVNEKHVIEENIFQVRIRKLKPLTSDSLRRVGKAASFYVREDINKILKQRNEKPLRAPCYDYKTQLKESRDRYFSEGYTLKAEDIKKYIITYEVKSFKDLYSKNKFLCSILGSRNLKNNFKIVLYRSLIDCGFWNELSFKKVNHLVPDCPSEINKSLLDDK